MLSPLLHRPLDPLPAQTRDALVRLARTMFDRQKPCIAALGDADVLLTAIETGLIEACPDGFRFAAPEALAQALALTLLAEAERAWASLPDLVGVFHRAWGRGAAIGVRPSSGGAGPGARLLVALQEQGYDVLGVLPLLFSAEHPEPGPPPAQRKLALEIAVREGLVALNPSSQQVATVGLAAARIYGDARTAGRNYFGLAGFARTHADDARAVLAQLEADAEDPDASALLPHLIHGLASANPDEALARAITLTESHGALQRHSGVLALGGLRFLPGDARLERVFDRLEALAGGEDSALSPALAEALCNGLADLAPERARHLLEHLAIQRGSANAASQVLLAIPPPLAPRDERPVLAALAAAPDLDAEGFERLRSRLSSCVETDPELVLDTVEAWVLARPYAGGRKASVAAAFGHVLQDVPDDVWARRLPVWLSHDEARIRRAGSDLVNAPEHLRRHWHFDPVALGVLGPNGLLYLARQCLGSIRDGRALCRLLLSLFECPHLPSEVATFVVDRLFDFVAYTHPTETEEVLSAVEGAAQPASHHAAQAVLERLRTQAAAQQALDRRPELFAPPQRVRAYRLAEDRRFRALMKQSEAEHPSIIRELFAEVQVRGGKGTITQNRDGTYTTSLFDLHQTEPFSLLGDVADPVGQALRRVRWTLEPRVPDAPSPGEAEAAPTPPDP